MKGFFDPLPRALAHRGNSRGFPENTEQAFRSAVEAGADVIETDVHLLKDREVVISHDDSFERLSGDSRKIRELTAQDLQEVDAGRTFSPDSGQTFPFREKGIHPLLLEEGLSLFPEVRFNIDLKDPGADLAEAVASVIRREGAEKRVCVGSFHHGALNTFRKALPEAATSLSRREILLVLLLYRFGWIPASVKEERAQAVQIPESVGPYRILRPSFFKWCRRNKLHLQIWTVNQESRMKSLFKEGVEGIFSDDPALIARVSRSLFDSGSPQT